MCVCVEGSSVLLVLRTWVPFDIVSRCFETQLIVLFFKKLLTC